MKHTIRISVLMFGLMMALLAGGVSLSTPVYTIADGGPLPLCPPDSPKTPRCPDGGDLPHVVQVNR
ncbi:MAG: hypothetical protein WBQ08_19440 [Candidatus Sulfotelmatobacter sp.]